MTHDDSIASFLFASFLSSYPPNDFNESLQEFLASPGARHFKPLEQEFATLITNARAIDEIRFRYIDLFDRGQSDCSLYESEYGQGRSFSKGSDLVDISAFYKAFGFESGADGSTIEMIDHVSVELEFYALMLMKEQALELAGNQEGRDVVFDGRRKFLEAHLGRLAHSINLRPTLAADSYFGLVFSCIAGLVENECKMLEISPLHAEWMASEREGEQMLCGAINSDEGAPNLVQIR